MHRGEWEGGLCDCCHSTTDCCCCFGAFLCPCVGYGLNYALATQNRNWCNACCCPCCVHMCLDAFVTTLLATINGSTTSVVVPFASFLRMYQRAQIQTEGEPESVLVTCCYECFCWSCSIAQMHRKLERRYTQGLPPFTGNSILGTLTPPSVNNHIHMRRRDDYDEDGHQAWT